MAVELKPRTSEANAKYWGARAQDWADIQEGTIRPVYETALKRLNVTQGTRYVDIGCGSGMAAAIAAEMGGTVSGIDASEALLDIARSRVPNADLRQGDIEALPFDDDAFDAATGFNSFQYAGNPVVALREAARVTKSGGSVVIVTWGEPEGMEAATIVAALKPLMPPPPPGAPGPFALSDKEALRAFAHDAGLTPVEIFDVESPFIYVDEATALKGLGSSGVAARAMEHSGKEAVDKAHAAAISPFKKPDGGIHLGATFRCLVAEA